MELMLHFRLAADACTKEYDQAVKHFLPAVLKSSMEILMNLHLVI